MPRIAATLGVFGLVVLALGLNMAQFPIEYRVATPDSAEPDDVALPPEVTRTPTVTLRTTKDEPRRVPRELVQPEPQPAPTEEDSGKPAEPLPPAAEDAEPDSDGQSAEAPTGQDSLPEQEAAPATATEERPPSPPDSADTSPDPVWLYDNLHAGGIYNPLEPQTVFAAGRPDTAETMPAGPPYPGMPAQAEPGPAYATSAPPSAARVREMVPVDRERASTPTEPDPTERVIRLPPVGNVWPGVPAEQPLGDGRLPADG